MRTIKKQNGHRGLIRPNLPLLAGCLTLASGGTAISQSADALIDKLVQKGMLTLDEAKELKRESDDNFKTAYSVRSGMPDWVQSMKLNGDFRARYDGIFQDNASNATPDRNRLRYRLRFGPTITLSDHFEVGIRLASGEVGSVTGLAQPVSSAFVGNIYTANSTLNNDAARKPVFIDAAYAKWTPKEWCQFQFGKMDNLFWITDAAIDYDYQPEGFQQRFSYHFNENHKVTLTAGQWVIAENYPSSGVGNSNDIYAFLEQVDWTAKWGKRFGTRVGVSSITYKNMGDMNPALEAFINQNGTPAVGVGAQPFNPIIARAEATYTLDSFPAFDGPFPITAGGEYLNNPAASDAFFVGKNYAGANNEGYNLGVILGSAKKRGNWQVNYNYKQLQSAVVWHGMNDDDFGFNAKGGTDVRGHHIKAFYKPADSMTVVMSYFITEQINNAPGTRVAQNRLFVDLMWSF
jgi:hypothetical protein